METPVLPSRVPEHILEKKELLACEISNGE